VNYWLMLPIVIVFGLLQGGFVERIGVRPAIKIKSGSAGSCPPSRWALFSKRC
jgi:hypothetical protein